MTDASFQSIAVKEIQGNVAIKARSGEIPKLTIQSNAGEDIIIDLLRPGASFNDIRLLQDGGILLIQRSTDDGSTWDTVGQFVGSSNGPGIVPALMTTAVRDAISSPTTGLVIYNTTTNKLNVYTGSGWEAVTSA